MTLVGTGISFYNGCFCTFSSSGFVLLVAATVAAQSEYARRDCCDFVRYVCNVSWVTFFHFEMVVSAPISLS